MHVAVVHACICFGYNITLELPTSRHLGTVLYHPPPGSTVEGANYSLYVLGGNGVLVEHHLAPQKLPTAPDGEDAPIELQHFSKLCWRLMGFVDYIKYSNQCNKTKLFERKSVLVCINRTSFLRSSRDL